MAWFYNLILRQNFKIGRVAISRRHTSPSASLGPKSAFSWGIRKFQNSAPAKNVKNAIFECLPKTGQFRGFCLWKKDNLSLWPVLVLASSHSSVFAFYLLVDFAHLHR